MTDEPWIGVDLDGTLAYYTEWRGDNHIGKPIGRMVTFVKSLRRSGKTIKIFTARANNGPDAVAAVKQWCIEVFGEEFEVTATKDFKMVALYDDRAFHVEHNTGRVIL